MTKYIPIDGSPQDVEPEDGEHFTLAEIHRIMNSENIAFNPIEPDMYYISKINAKKMFNSNAYSILKGFKNLVACVVGDIMVVNKSQIIKLIK